MFFFFKYHISPLWMQPLNTLLHTNWQNVQKHLLQLLNQTPTQNNHIIVHVCASMNITVYITNSYMCDIWSEKDAIPQEMRMPSETVRPLVLYMNKHLPAKAYSRVMNELICILKQSFDFVFRDNPC